MGHYDDFYYAAERTALLKSQGLYDEWMAAEGDAADTIYWKARALDAEQRLTNIQRDGRCLIDAIYGGPVRTL